MAEPRGPREALHPVLAPALQAIKVISNRIDWWRFSTDFEAQTGFAAGILWRDSHSCFRAETVARVSHARSSTITALGCRQARIRSAEHRCDTSARSHSSQWFQACGGAHLVGAVPEFRVFSEELDEVGCRYPDSLRGIARSSATG